MIKIHKTVEGQLFPMDEFVPGAWINLIGPSSDELRKVSEELEVDMDFLRAPLDYEESPRIEVEEGQIFILVDIPLVDKEAEGRVYDTLPLGIVLTDENIITVCLKDNPILHRFERARIKSFFTFKKTRFVLQILFTTASYYLMYLKQIDRMSNEIERQLHRSMKNKELIQLLELEKSLVYFSTSLKANEIVMEKMLKMTAVKKYPEDEDLLEDVIIENKQAIEMAHIYSSILSGMMDAFASVISNNLNIVMKFLAAVTIVLSIPTMLASFYGMNVGLPLQNSPYAFLAVIVTSVVLSGLTVYLLFKRDML